MSLLSVLFLLCAGLALGFVFYGGLWLTVRSLPTSRHPVRLTLCSFWMRTLVVLAGFLFLINGNWRHALISLLGFAVGRLAVSRYFVPAETRLKCP